MASGTTYSSEDVIGVIFQDEGSEIEDFSAASDDDVDEFDMSIEKNASASREGETAEIYQSGKCGGGNMRRSQTRKGNSQEFNWEMYEDIDPFASDWLVDYSERPGILVDTSDFKPVDYFKLFFPSEAFNLIANETNRYAAQYLDSHPNLPQNSRFLAWRVTSPDEMQAFVALQIAMGLCEKPTVEDYWSKYWLTFTDFQKVMPRNRYELLQSFIHFCNLNDQVERGNEGYNPLFKIQPLLDLTDPTYEKVYQPKRNLSIDESMVKFKGRIFFRQYLPKKPTKWGIKEFMLSEAESGYALKSIIYTGKTSFTRDPGVNLTDQVVLTLLDGYEGKGHIVFMDNFYSSPGLYCMLEEKNIGACGTVAGNRVGMPSQLKRDDLKLKKGDEPVFMRCGNLVACAWQDTKRVTMLSTVDTNLTIDKKIRSKGSPGGCRLVSKPVMVERYNQCMAGVDRFDQMVGTYQYPHKCMKWYHTIYHRVIEVALVNGYIIYKKTNTNNKLTPVAFRQQVIDGLLDGWEYNGVRQGRPRSASINTQLRLLGRHFIAKFENSKYKPDCTVCSDRKNKKRCQTSYFCKQCNVPLCVVPCFERYHSLVNYKS